MCEGHEEVDVTHKPFKHLTGELAGQLAISQKVYSKSIHFPDAHL